MEAYRTAMDAHYDALSAQKSERAMETYKQRVDNLLEADTQSIRREQRILREKLDRLLNRINKTEENLERFTGKGAESIRSQYEKSMGADKKKSKTSSPSSKCSAKPRRKPKPKKRRAKRIDHVREGNSLHVYPSSLSHRK